MLDFGDNTLQTLKISKLENDLQMKNLEIAGKNDEIAVQKIQIMELTDDKERLKEEIELKNSVDESNSNRIKSLENDLKQKSDRVKILEAFVNKLMAENKVLRTRKGETSKAKADKTADSLRKELKDKCDKITILTKHKSDLVNELAKCQENMRKEGHPDIIEKCIKLTEETTTLKTEVKSLQRENKQLKDAAAGMQVQLN